MDNFSGGIRANYSLARSILGFDFIMPGEIVGLYYYEQLSLLAKMMPSVELLRWCKENNYIVMPAPPYNMSIVDFRAFRSNHFHCTQSLWYLKERFAHKDRSSWGWLLIKKEPVPNSTSLGWGEQCNLLSPLESVPNAMEMVWLLDIYAEVRESLLFEDRYVRTASIDSLCRQVVVANFSSIGIDLRTYQNDKQSQSIGLAVMRKHTEFDPF